MNDTFEPSLAHLQESLWTWAAQTNPDSELYKTLWAWCQVIDAVGDDLDMRSSTACPTFRVAKMMVAGK